MKCDAVALVDALAPPDFILNSPLGQSDGDVKLIADLLLLDIYFFFGIDLQKSPGYLFPKSRSI
jgi:Acyl-CoA oxidase